MNIALYSRVSTSDKGQSADNQLIQLRDYAAKQGWTVAEEYIDDESGRKGRNERKAFDQMFQDAARREFDLVLFWALDRFSRQGMAKTVQYLQQLDSYGVLFHSYTEPDLSTDNDMVRNILLALLSSLAKLESDKISLRTKAGLERARANGKKLGRKSIIPLVLPHVREMEGQLTLDGRPITAKQMAQRVSRRLGRSVSVSTIRRCKNINIDVY